MKETMALLLGFFFLAFGGRFLYRGYSWLCGRLTGNAADFPQDSEPTALVLTGFSLVTLFTMMTMAYMVMIMDLSLSIGSVLLAGLLILLFDNILIFAGFQYSRQKNRQDFADQLVSQKQRAEAGYYKALEEQYDRQGVLVHDIRRHLGIIRHLADEYGDEAVARYVEELEVSPALQNKVRICGNHILDVVLCRYKEICQKKGIAFLADVRNKSVDFLEQSDITALFGNLLENAVEAAEGGAEPYLELQVDIRPGGLLFIALVNSCRELPRSDGLGGFLTRKADGGKHGIGMKSIKGIVKKYEGTIKQYYEEGDGSFHTVILLKPC